MIKKSIILTVIILGIFGIVFLVNMKHNESEGIANPASVFCEKNGGTLEIKEDVNGSQYGFCIFQDKSECDEWKFFRGECKIGDSLNISENSKCLVDSDCVPSTCCHPNSCINKNNAPNCSGAICTMSCAIGTIDCGQGNCQCINGNCRAVLF